MVLAHPALHHLRKKSHPRRYMRRGWHLESVGLRSIEKMIARKRYYKVRQAKELDEYGPTKI